MHLLCVVTIECKLKVDRYVIYLQVQLEPIIDNEQKYRLTWSVENYRLICFEVFIPCKSQLVINNIDNEQKQSYLARRRKTTGNMTILLFPIFIMQSFMIRVIYFIGLFCAFHKMHLSFVVLLYTSLTHMSNFCHLHYQGLISLTH